VKRSVTGPANALHGVDHSPGGLSGPSTACDARPELDYLVALVEAQQELAVNSEPGDERAEAGGGKIDGSAIVSAHAHRLRRPFVVSEKRLRRDGQRESEFVHRLSQNRTSRPRRPARPRGGRRNRGRRGRSATNHKQAYKRKVTFTLAPPRNETELFARACALSGRSVDALAEDLGVPATFDGARAKGKVGTLVERALGATGGSAATWDFPALRVELKTIPVEAGGLPRESTFVCSVSLSDAEHAEWAPSWARAKLSRVLWVPVSVGPDATRRIGSALLWSPSVQQERVLADDFEEILGRVGAGEIEAMTGRVGRWLQLRPKAAHGRVRTLAPGGMHGQRVPTVPRGLYLRARFTGAILREPLALP